MRPGSSPGIVRDVAAHARLDRVEERNRDHDRDGLRLAAIDAALGSVANGHRELAKLVAENHRATTRAIERVQALLVAVIAGGTCMMNGASPEATAVVTGAVLALAAGSPDLTRRLLERFARSRGIEAEAELPKNERRTRADDA